MFGGQVAGQALVAAARTVDAGPPRPLAARLLPAPRRPRACRSSTRSTASATAARFTTRRVVAIQHGQAIFNLPASFHVPEDGLEHQVADARRCPTPRRCPTSRTRMAPYKPTASATGTTGPRPIDPRHVDWQPAGPRRSRCRPHQRVWLRADGTLPDDPVLHACVAHLRVAT